MSELPRISVVTSSYNQGRYIRRTIESVLAQRYPNLEHLVIDGLSTDETAAILEDYPHLRIVRERDSGQAEAINKGFRLATGQIFCFLNSDDTFEPGALHRVAEEIAPERGRHVVMGRCRFIDEDDGFIGVEHPSAFESHRRVLEIWKGYAIPQPAVFWTPEVWQRCGPLDEREQLVLDYDLFCRFSRHYHFHTFDQVVANYRLHVHSKTQGVDDETRLRDSVRVSQRYWGPAWSPLGAVVRASYLAYRLDRRGRAYKALLAGRSEWQRGRHAAALPRFAAGTLLGPDVALHALIGPLARRTGGRLVTTAMRLRRRVAKPALSPHTQAWNGFNGVHPDGWVGPSLVRELVVDSSGDVENVLLEVETVPEALPRPLVLQLSIGTAIEVTLQVGTSRTFSGLVPLRGLGPGRYELRVKANAFLVPHDRWGNGDYRPLSYRLLTCTPMTRTARVTSA